jgi:hypothetical protein
MGQKKNKAKKSKGNKNKGGNNKNKESRSTRRNNNRESLKKIAAQNFNKFAEQVSNLGLRIKGNI